MAQFKVAACSAVSGESRWPVHLTPPFLIINRFVLGHWHIMRAAAAAAAMIDRFPCTAEYQYTNHLFGYLKNRCARIIGEHFSDLMLRARARERDRVIRSNRRGARERRRCSTKAFKHREIHGYKKHTHAEKTRSARSRARKCYNWISMRNCSPARWYAHLNWFGHVCAASISSSKIV